jgi:DNA-directed RNA polymerase subunit RPC12/RpoP
MVLQFLCPNGHKVHCPEERAGQAAKCPRCGVRFRIPSAEELGLAVAPLAEGVEAAAGSTSQPDSRLAREGAASGVSLGAAAGADEIEFLCPNDHLLHGPAALQGRPGQCPECGSRFRIPSYKDIAVSEPPQPEAAAGLDSDSSSVEIGGVAHGSGSDRGAVPPDAAANEASRAGGRHPVAQLMGRLWKLKSLGATVEIRYGEGHRLTPDDFVRSLSSATHGVFAVREPNGTLTLTAMPWDSIHVVIARGVRQLEE